MNVPADLNRLIQDALLGVRSDPVHYLPLGRREEVMAALGPRMDSTLAFGGPGHHRRTVLDLFAVRHVLPRWQAVWPDDDSPQEVLSYAEQVLRGQGGSGDAVRRRILWLWTVFDDFSSDDNDQHPFQSIVLLAAIKVLERARNDRGLNPANVDRGATDEPLPFRQTDAAFDACIAAAQGAPWYPPSDPAARLKFWEWWLTEAVPAAWAAVLE